MGVGLGALRHLDLTGRPAVHSLHLESVCYQCRPVSCCDTASQLLTQKALQEACSPYDTRRMARSPGYHLSSNLWLVSSFLIMALECSGILARRWKMYCIKVCQENIWPCLKGCYEGVLQKLLLLIWATTTFTIPNRIQRFRNCSSFHELQVSFQVGNRCDLTNVLFYSEF